MDTKLNEKQIYDKVNYAIMCENNARVSLHTERYSSDTRPELQQCAEEFESAARAYKQLGWSNKEKDMIKEAIKIREDLGQSDAVRGLKEGLSAMEAPPAQIAPEPKSQGEMLEMLKMLRKSANEFGSSPASGIVDVVKDMDEICGSDSEALKICWMLVDCHASLNPEISKGKEFFDAIDRMRIRRTGAEYRYRESEPIKILKELKMTGSDIQELYYDVCKGDAADTYLALVGLYLLNLSGRSLIRYADK